MGVKIKGGHTTVVGKGKVNIGPTIPTNGLVLYIDPATLLNSTNTDPLVARSPLTSSTFTVARSSSFSADVVALAAGSSNTAIGVRSYPTGALTPVFYGNSANYMSEGTDLFSTGVFIANNALNLLKQHITKEMTIVVWWSGVGISTAYPGSGTTPTQGSDKSFAMGLNNWPPYNSPVSWSLNADSLSAVYPGFLGHRQTLSATNGRTYNNLFSNLPFVATSSILLDQFQSASVGRNVQYGLSASGVPTYTSASAALPNIPYWYRDIDNRFAGRTVYNTNDFWNCTAFTIDKGVANPHAVTQSIFMNGVLYGRRSGASSSYVGGSTNKGSVASITAYDLTPSRTASFLLSAAVTSKLIFSPRNPSGSDIYNSADGSYTFYFETGSTFSDTITNLVNKINSPISSASLYITASTVGSTGIAITGSLPGILSNYVFRFSSSIVPQENLFTLTGGTQNTGTGPIQDIFTLAPVNSNFYNALSIGSLNTSNVASSRQRTGTIGAIGGIYIYNRQLSQQELAQIYNTQKGKYGNIRPSGVPIQPYRIMNPLDSTNQETPPASSGIGY